MDGSAWLGQMQIRCCSTSVLSLLLVFGSIAHGWKLIKMMIYPKHSARHLQFSMWDVRLRQWRCGLMKWPAKLICSHRPGFETHSRP